MSAKHTLVQRHPRAIYPARATPQVHESLSPTDLLTSLYGVTTKEANVQSHGRAVVTLTHIREKETSVQGRRDQQVSSKATAGSSDFSRVFVVFPNPSESLSSGE